jgi:hypothetical protein
MLLAPAETRAQPVRAAAPDFDAVLATVGNRSITVRDFVERYESTPWLGRERRGLAERHRIEFLVSMIAEELLAMEADRRGFGHHPAVRRTIDEIERLHVMDALYRVEITEPVVIAPEDVDRVLPLYLVQVTLQYMVFDNAERANAVFEAVRFGVPFDSLATAVDQAGKYETRRWGDLAPAVEEAIYDTLEAGHVYAPFLVDEEWYVMKLVGVRHEHLGGPAEIASARDRVEKTLRWRRERDRYGSFMTAFSRGKGAEVNGFLVKDLAAEIRRILGNRIDALDAMNEYPFPLSLEGADFEHLRRTFRDRQQEAVITAGVFALPLDYVLDRMAFKGFTLQHEEETISERLSGLIQKLIHEEYLAREGYDRHLDDRPAVRRDVSRWERAHLAYSLMRTLATEVQTDAPAPRVEVRIREVVSGSAEEAERIMGLIAAGEDLSALARAYSTRAESRRADGDTGYFLSSERGDVGHAAALVEPGDMVGPVRDEGQYVVFQLLDRREPHAAAGTATGEAGRASRRINERIAALASESDVSIDLERLRGVSTTDVNTVVWRYLGFGNRMPAVPTLYKMVDWLDLLSPEMRPL